MQLFQMFERIIATLFKNRLVALKRLGDQIFGLVALDLQFAQGVIQLRRNLVTVGDPSFALVHQLFQLFFLRQLGV